MMITKINGTTQMRQKAIRIIWKINSVTLETEFTGLVFFIFSYTSFLE